MANIHDVVYTAYSDNEYLKGKNIYIVGYSKVKIQSWSGDPGFVSYGCCKLNDNDIWTDPFPVYNCVSRIIPQVQTKVYFKAYNKESDSYSNTVSFDLVGVKTYLEPSISSAKFTRGTLQGTSWTDSNTGSDMKIDISAFVNEFGISDENSANVRVFINSEFKGEENNIHNGSNIIYITSWNEFISGTLELQIADRVNPNMYMSYFFPYLSGIAGDDYPLTYIVIEDYV